MVNEFKDKKILITGGAGSLGQALVKSLLKKSPAIIRVLDIDETRLFLLENELESPKIRVFVGNVIDKDRLVRAMEGVDYVFLLAALKHVKSCEYDPFEAVKTNIFGIQNMIEAALINNVNKVIFTSSDKAANPNNTMGATKLLGEKLINSANHSKGSRRTRFSSVRFGNVMGSRGSVIPLFKKQISEGRDLTVTDPNMSRYMMSQSQAISLILKCTELTQNGGGTFILKMPVVRLGDLVEVLIEESGKRGIKIRKIGMKPGETSFEELMSEEERRIAIEKSNMFIIPSFLSMHKAGIEIGMDDKIKDKKGYDSRYEVPMTKEELRNLLKKEKLV